MFQRDKYELAKDTILEEFDKFKRGEFDVDKLELAKKLLFHIDMKLPTTEKYYRGHAESIAFRL